MKHATRRTGVRRTGVRRTGVLAAAALAAAVLAACGAAPARPAALTATRQIHVSPVGADGSPVRGYRTVATVAGANCESGSEAIGRAYRCFAGSSLYDPCWAVRVGTPTVLCLGYPWSVAVVRLAVGAPLSAISAEPGVGEPWGVELANGQRCLLLQGAHSLLAGRVIDYYCNAQLSLLRGLTRTAPVWRAASVTGAAGKQALGPSEQIRIAWFGSPDTYR